MKANLILPTDVVKSTRVKIKDGYVINVELTFNSGYQLSYDCEIPSEKENGVYTIIQQLSIISHDELTK